MLNPTKIIKKAKSSPKYLWLLNFGLARNIPFNKPHGFKILEIGDDHITTFLPFKKANLNHIKGLHACALATLSEFTTGLTLIQKLNAKKYRIILKNLNLTYHYQGKSGATATFEANEEWIDRYILDPLKYEDSVTVMCQVNSYDTNNNHLCTGMVEWQIKEWKKVRTKV